MAYLGTYIQELLKRKQDVTLPGFGSLVVKSPSGIKSGDGKISPPGYNILFDEKHPKEDNVLADKYAEGEGISVEEARQQVLELVDAIKFRLDKGEDFTLEELGQFSRDDSNKIHFSKSSEWSIDPDSFGLEPLELLELEEEDSTDIDATFTEEVKREKAEPKSSVSTSPKAPTVSVSKEPVNKWKIIWIVVVGLILVLVAILLIPSNNDGVSIGRDGIILRQDENQRPAQKTVPNNINGSNKDEEQSANQAENSDSDNIDGSENDILPDRDVEIEPGYFVIAGSFKNLINATEMKDQLVESGFPAEIIYTENRLYRVSIQSFKTKAEAMNALPSIKSKSSNNNLWIMNR